MTARKRKRLGEWAVLGPMLAIILSNIWRFFWCLTSPLAALVPSIKPKLREVCGTPRKTVITPPATEPRFVLLSQVSHSP